MATKEITAIRSNTVELGLGGAGGVGGLSGQGDG